MGIDNLSETSQTDTSTNESSEEGILGFMDKNRETTYRSLYQHHRAGIRELIFSAIDTLDEIAREPDSLVIGLMSVASNSDIPFGPLREVGDIDMLDNEGDHTENVNSWLHDSINRTLSQMYDPEALAIINDIVQRLRYGW